MREALDDDGAGARILENAPGTLAFFRGRHSLHRVTPVVGSTPRLNSVLTYGADPVLAQRLGLTRQWLHAVRLRFDHPGTGARVDVSSAYPEDLQHALDVLRGE